MPAFHCPACVWACSYQGATAPDLHLKLHLSVSSLRFLLEGYQISYEKKDTKPTGSSVSYLNTNIHKSFTIFFTHRDLGQADVGEFLEKPSMAYVQPQSPSIISSYKSVAIPRGSELAQPPIFFLFSPRLAQLHWDCSQPVSSVVILCDPDPFPPDQVALNK